MCRLSVRFKAAPRGRSRRRLGAWPSLTLPLPLRRASAGRLARKAKYLGAAINRVSSWAASGFDKGTLAMAHIGLMGAGEKPARFADKRTGHRPLSTPATPSARSSPHTSHAGQTADALSVKERLQALSQVLSTIY